MKQGLLELLPATSSVGAREAHTNLFFRSIWMERVQHIFLTIKHYIGRCCMGGRMEFTFGTGWKSYMIVWQKNNPLKGLLGIIFGFLSSILLGR